MVECGCHQVHTRRRVVLTGGRGAGKTAVLELVRQHLCRHVDVLAESASILFSLAGFCAEQLRQAGAPPSGQFSLETIFGKRGVSIAVTAIAQTPKRGPIGHPMLGLSR
jgi:hypothetical protein